MNVLLIIYKGDENKISTLRDRLAFIGQLMYVYDDMYFVVTDLVPKDAYIKISVDILEAESILIVNFPNLLMSGFWGRMPPELWTWLNQCEPSTTDALASHYKDLYTDLLGKLEQSYAQLEEARKNINEQDKINDNLQHQIFALKKQLIELTKLKGQDDV